MATNGKFYYNQRGRGKYNEYNKRNPSFEFGETWSSSHSQQRYNPRQRGFARGGRGQHRNHEDIQMRDNAEKRHQMAYKMKSPNASINRGYNLKVLPEFHRMKITNGNHLSKEELMEHLKAYIDDDAFVPKLYNKYSHSIQFYIEKNIEICRALVGLSNRILLHNGRKLIIYCKYHTQPPYMPLSRNQFEVVERAMSERYSAELSRLDLKNFHNDPRLVAENIFCPLLRQRNLSKIINIVRKSIPEIKSLDLSDNYICHTSWLDELVEFRCLETLNLANNKMKSVSVIAPTPLSVTELTLEGNPLCDVFKNKTHYTNHVRKNFTKLLRLDGVDLPKPISFGFEDDLGKMPPTKPSFFHSEEAKTIILQFIEQYYQAFESDKRLLEAAYTLDAKFSFSTSMSLPEIAHLIGSDVLKTVKRNLLEGNKFEVEPIISGNREIVDFLNKFPKLRHLPHTFVVDTPFVVPQLMNIVLRGVFLPANQGATYLAFTRNLLIVPMGSGFCISNEELSFQLASPKQTQNARKIDASAAASQPQPPPQPQPQPSSGLDLAKTEMLRHFTATTKMLPHFSRECLERNEWNLIKAQQMFATLRTENKIPLEYFSTAL